MTECVLWCSGYGIGLAINTLQVRIPATPLPGNDLGQVVHTHIPLLRSSVSLYRYKCWEGNGIMEERWSVIRNAGCKLTAGSPLPFTQWIATRLTTPFLKKACTFTIWKSGQKLEVWGAITLCILFFHTSCTAGLRHRLIVIQQWRTYRWQFGSFAVFRQCNWVSELLWMWSCMMHRRRTLSLPILL